MNPDQMSLMLDQFFNNNIMGKLLVYAGYTLLAVSIIAFFIFIYFIIQYKYKVIYPVILYDSDGNSAQILRYKKDRARIIKNKNGTKKTHFLFQNKKTEPLRQEDIKPGNRINLLRINDDGTYTSIPSFNLGITVDRDGIEHKVPKEFEYLTNEQRTWVLLELKETAEANETGDAQKRIFNYTMIAIIILVAFVMLGIWLTLKYTGNVSTALEGTTGQLANIARSIGGVAPN